MARHANAILFVVLSGLWGTAFVAIKAGLEYLPPVLFAGFRYDLAAVLLLGYAALGPIEWLPRTRTDVVAIGVGATLLIALYNALLFVGQQGVTSGMAAIIVAMVPILATVFAWLLLSDERLRLLGLAGLLVGFLGVGLVVRPDPTGLAIDELLAPGLVLAAAGAAALGGVLIQRLQADLSSFGLVAWSCAIGAVMLHGISFGLPGESFDQASLTLEAILTIVYLAVFASAIGYFLYFELLDRLGAIEISLVTYASPVFAALFGWLLLGETLDGLTIVGFLTILAGFVLIKRRALADALGVADGSRQGR